MGGFELCGTDHAKGSVESSLVVPVDPAGGGVFDVGQCLVGAVVEEMVRLGVVPASPLTDAVRVVAAVCRVVVGGVQVSGVGVSHSVLRH